MQPVSLLVDIPSSDNVATSVGADFNRETTITVIPPSSMACIDFTDIVVDDDIALERDQCFTICVGNSSANVVIIDDDSESILHWSLLCKTHILHFVSLVPRFVSGSVVINENEGSAVVTVELLSEIENNFTLIYTTGEVEDGADGI